MYKQGDEKTMEDETLIKLGIARSSVYIIRERSTAAMMAGDRNKLVALGDDDEYIICKNNCDAGKFKKAGYQVCNGNTI